jgi:hypothetical protein
MKATTKILIGGKALVNLGSSRGTLDTDYLINDVTTKEVFVHDAENDIDYLNANGNSFFSEIYKIEENNDQATPQSLLELKSYAFVQHCQNFNFKKADEAEFDMKFLIREFNLTGVKTVTKHISEGELSEVEKIIRSVKF